MYSIQISACWIFQDANGYSLHYPMVAQSAHSQGNTAVTQITAPIV